MDLFEFDKGATLFDPEAEERRAILDALPEGADPFEALFAGKPSPSEEYRAEKVAREAKNDAT